MKAVFSSTVWNRPWLSLEVVSMNLRSVFSKVRRLVCTSKDLWSVSTGFLVPTTQPFSMTVSLSLHRSGQSYLEGWCSYQTDHNWWKHCSWWACHPTWGNPGQSCRSCWSLCGDGNFSAQPEPQRRPLGQDGRPKYRQPCTAPMGFAG